MLTLKCINTGSLGNMYLLDNDGEQLLIELGVDFNRLLLNLDNINNIVGCILSHYHCDHYKEKVFKEVSNCGIKILSYKNTKIGKKYKLGNFEIIPLPAVHNVECRSFYIKVDGNTLLFATDTKLLPKINLKVDYFVVEVNYIDDLRENLILSDTTQDTNHFASIYHNHHSLESAVDYFENLSYKPKKIVTIHKSNSGILDEKKVIKYLKPYAKEAVYVASNNTNYILEEV